MQVSVAVVLKERRLS